MRTDRYTKTLLTVMAVLLTLVVLRPIGVAEPAHGAGDALTTPSLPVAELQRLNKTMEALARDVGSLEDDLNDLVRGYCRNKKLC